MLQSRRIMLSQTSDPCQTHAWPESYLSLKKYGVQFRAVVEPIRMLGFVGFKI